MYPRSIKISYIKYAELFARGGDYEAKRLALRVLVTLYYSEFDLGGSMKAQRQYSKRPRMYRLLLLRAKGKTFKDMGRICGFSANRMSKLVYLYQRKLRYGLDIQYGGDRDY